MGITSLPRLYFKGQFFWSPSTYNNNDYAPALETYDPTSSKLNWSFLREQGVNTDEEFKEWSTRPISTQPSQPYTLPPSEWGYYGGNQCGFVTKTAPAINDENFSIPIGPNRFHTETTGYTNDKVKFIKKDPWIGLPLQFNPNFKPAKLVDINPVLPWTSQVFSDKFTIGDSSCGEGFSAPVQYRMHSRWIYTSRNYNADGQLIIAGGISTFFQTVVHKKDISYFNSQPKPGSYQAQLQKGLKGSDGIMIRFTVYDTIYFQGKPFEALHKKADNNDDQVTELMVRISILYQNYQKELAEYNSGKSSIKPTPPVNRAYSRLVGWTGLWQKDELISMADGRTMMPLVLPGQPPGLPTPNLVQAKGLPSRYYELDKQGQSLSQIALGPINIGTVESKGKVERITVDIGSTMPELDSTGRKADFGKVVLKLYDLSNKKYIDIATLENDVESYQKTSGIFDITEIPKEVHGLTAENPFALFVDSFDATTAKQTQTLALIENPIMSNTNERGLYVNQPNPYWGEEIEKEFTIKVQYFGKAPSNNHLQLAIGQYTSAFDLISENIPNAGGGFQQLPFVQLENNGQIVNNSSTMIVPSNGLVSIKVKALQPGMPFLVFYPFLENSGFNGPGDLQQAPTYYSYNAIRVLPFDNNLAEEFESWLSSLPTPNKVNDLIGRVNQRVFDDVFRTFHLMYPVMGFIGCPTKFQEWRGRILSLTGPDSFNSAAYMPVTRSLSAGQRQILVAYANFLAKLPAFEAASKFAQNHFNR